MDEPSGLDDFDGRCRLFPLPGVVLFPHAVLPLHIFEPRYKQMTADALATDRRVAIVQVRPSEWPKLGGPPIEPVACLGRILTHERLPDGRFNFLLLGLKRVRIARELAVATLYRQAEVEILEDVEPDTEDEARAHRGELAELYRGVAARVHGLDPDLDRFLRTDPALGATTDLLAQSLGLPAEVKQALLAETLATRRAEVLATILREVTAQLDAPHPPPRPSAPPFSMN